MIEFLPYDPKKQYKCDWCGESWAIYKHVYDGDDPYPLLGVDSGVLIRCADCAPNLKVYPRVLWP